MNVRRAFWHVIALAILIARDPSENVSDEDYSWYRDFMRRHSQL